MEEFKEALDRLAGEAMDNGVTVDEIVEALNAKASALGAGGGDAEGAGAEAEDKED